MAYILKIQSLAFNQLWLSTIFKRQQTTKDDKVAKTDGGKCRIIFFGPYEHLHSKLQNKMATVKLGFEISALTTIPERADVGDGSGGEQGTSETPPKPLR